MDCQMVCGHCQEEYHGSNMARILVGCGHTFCENCLRKLIEEDEGVLYIYCPEDSCQPTQLKTRNINRLPKNIALMKMIESKKDKETIYFKENSINVSKITKISSGHDDQDSTQLMDIMDCSHEESCSKNIVIQNDQSFLQDKVQICPKHKKPMDVVCTVDLQKICSSCAIFGQHKGHSFKSIEEIGNIQQEYSKSIKAIMSQKQKIYQQIASNEIKTQILSILQSKKTKLKGKIMDEFTKLENLISTKKKEVLKNLEEEVKKEENNLKNCIKIDDKLIETFNKWNKKSQNQLKILNENDFEQKLILLFEGKNIDGDIIQEGQLLIQNLKKEEQKIMEEVQKKLQNINLTIKEDIYECIEGFISISSQSYKQISSITIKANPNNYISQRSSLAPININSSIGTIPRMNSQTNLPLRKNFEKKELLGNNHPQSSYLHVQGGSSPNALDQSLLENDDGSEEPYVAIFDPKMNSGNTGGRPSPPQNAAYSQRFSFQPNILQSPQEKPHDTSRPHLAKNSTTQNQEVKGQKLTKKRLSRMKLPERFEKIVQSLISDSLEIVDFTNGQFGDSNTFIICESIQGSKARTLKLIRNKLTDQGVAKILPFLSNITTLNLSQNLLTENILDILYENRKCLKSIRTVILSQNKIVERKSKQKIDLLKKLDWNVSI